MKKFLPVLTLLTLILPVVALSAPVVQPTTCKLVADLTNIDPACSDGATVSIETLGACCAINSVYKIANVIFIVLVALSIVFFLLGAGTLVIAAGAPEKVASGRNYILYAIIGLAAAFLARAVPAVAKFFIGGV